MSLESSPQWRGDTAVLLEAQGLSCDLRLCHAADFPAQVNQMPDNSVDLVMIDFTEGERASRLACIGTAAPKVRPGGHIVLDDSDRPQYASANELLRGWSPKRLKGMKALPLHATETTFYRRPSPVSS